jgi:carboxypeptidase family protein
MGRVVWRLISLGGVAVVVAALAARGAHAQELRGVVRDSASGLPIPGAVVTLLDSTATGVARTITNEGGQFRVVLLSNVVRRVRIVRLGFRPIAARLPDPVDGIIRMDIEMASISMSLTPVQITTARPNCPRRRDREAALGLLEQVRAALLATIVARSDKPARMMRLRATRTMDGYSDRVVHQRVSIDSAGTTVTSFGAARNAAEFVRNGFTTDSAGVTIYFGPDAEVLLDDGFSAGYCFHLMDPTRPRPNQIGLGFSPAKQRGGRIDVDGALWIDTVARALVDIEYRYLGLDPRVEAFQPGGHIWFREMPNGVVVIERWLIRIVGGNEGEYVRPLIRKLTEAGRPVPRSRSVYGVEVWGELARAVWPDGTSWAGPLGTIHLRAVDDAGTPLPGTIVRLDDTDYQASADSAGNIELPDLVPGPYSVSVVDPKLAALGITLSTPLEFTASRRWAILTRLHVPPTDEYVGDLCRSGGVDGAGVRSLLIAGSGALVGRVTTSGGRPVPDARWTLRYRDFLGEHRPVKNGAVSADGTFQYCGLRRGESVVVELTAKAMEPTSVNATLSGQTTIVTAIMRPR